MVRFLTAACVLAMAAFPAAAQAPAGPLVTAQTAPLGKILADIRTAADMIGGPDAVEQFNESLKEGLGEKGFAGLDLTRRVVAYGDFADEPEQSSGVVVLPITGEDEFKAFVGRLGPDGDKLKLVPVDGQEGLYAVRANDGEDDGPVRLRFHDRAAYIGINVPDEAMAVKGLLPAAKLIRPTDNSVFSYEFHLSRYKGNAKKKLAERQKELAAQIDSLPLPPAVVKALEGLMAMSSRMSESVMADGEVGAYRLKFDADTGLAVIETALIPKPGTKLAADLAARERTTNRFAGLVGKETAAGFLTRLPLFAPELKEAAAAGIDAIDLVATDLPEDAKPLVDEVKAGLTRTVKTGRFDLAACVSGPNEQDQFGVSVAVAFEDTAKLEKELRALFDKFKGDLPALNFIKLDVAKVDGVNIHEAPLGAFVPEPAQTVFGKTSSAYFAFGPHGIYLTFGPTALADIKAAIALKPAEAKVLNVVANPARLKKLVAAAAPDTPVEVLAALEGPDALISAFDIHVEGGKELRVQFGMNLKLLPRASFLGMSAEQSFEPIEE